jgi:hypothetical protein
VSLIQRSSDAVPFCHTVSDEQKTGQVIPAPEAVGTGPTLIARQGAPLFCGG